MEEEQYDELFLVLEEPQGGYTVPLPSVNHTPSISSLQPVQSSSTRQSVVHDFLNSADGPREQRFAPLKSDKEVEAARKASMPKKTRNDMDYCMRM